jgi:hypothetical protein
MSTARTVLAVSLAVGLTMITVGACESAGTKSAGPKKAVVHMEPAATEYRTPDACKEAIASARKVFSIASDGMGIGADDIGMIPEIISAITDSDVDGLNSITDRIKANTTKTQGLTADLTAEGATFNAAAADCD